MGRLSENCRVREPFIDSSLATGNCFEIHSVHSAESTVVIVAGEVDLCTAPRLAEELQRSLHAGRNTIVDLERVEFMDCAGLRALVSASAGAQLGRTHFSVTTGSPQVQKLFRLAGMAEVLDLIPPACDRAAA